MSSNLDFIVNFKLVSDEIKNTNMHDLVCKNNHEQLKRGFFKYDLHKESRKKMTDYFFQ